MTVLSDSLFLVRLPSGARAVYSVQPQHLNDRPETTLESRAIEHGTALALQIHGQWYDTMRRPIENLRTIALLERTPNAWGHE
jgi:hypothetical protein